MLANCFHYREYSKRSKLIRYRLQEVVEDVVKNYSITFNVESDSIVLTDEAFHSIIDNIIRNAVVHGKTDKIDITTTCKDDICEIRIADYGGDTHVEDNKPNGAVLVIKLKGDKNER